MAEHGASIMAGGGAAWATCLCGWGSVEYRTAAGASAAWAEHIATTPRPHEPEPETSGEA